jgi:hypothetical protein
MGYTTVRVSEATRDLLRKLALREGGSMQAVLEKALEAYRRREFLDGLNRAYASLRSDPGQWADLEDERTAWDVTIADGLPPEDRASKRPRARRTASRRR